MKIRWLHKIWTAFWTTAGVLLIIAALLGGGMYGVLQLPSSKEYVARQIEKKVGEGREAYLSIDKLDGHLPFSVKLTGINMFADSLAETPFIHSDSLQASIDITTLLKKTLTISSLTVFEPVVLMDASDRGFFKKIARKSEVADTSEVNVKKKSGSFDLLIPNLRITEGLVQIQHIDTSSQLVDKEQLTLERLSLNVFLEYSEMQKYLDIESLTFGVPEAGIDELRMFGQVFNDSTTFELNAFNIQAGNDYVLFNGGATDLDLFGGALSDQLKNTKFELSLKELQIGLENLHRLSPQVPSLPQNLMLKLQAKGSSENITLSDVHFGVGKSMFLGSGDFVPPVYGQSLKYQASIEQVSADKNDLELWFPGLSDSQRVALASVSGELSVTGTDKLINLDVVSASNNGRMELSGSSTINASPKMDITAKLRNLNLGGLFHSNLNRTDLSGSITFNTSSFDPKTASGELQIQFGDGSINAFEFDSLTVISGWSDAELTPSYSITSTTTGLGGSGTVSLKDSVPEVELNGFATNFDLKGLTQLEQLSSSLLDLEYDFYGKGNSLTNAFGQLTIDIPRSIVGGDTLSNHQIYVDYSTDTNENKNLRLTSNVMDVTLNGGFNPNEFLKLVPSWMSYFKHRVNHEVLFQPATPYVAMDSTRDQNLAVKIELKDYPLLASYWNNLPDIQSSFVFNSQLNMNNERVLFTGNFNDSKIIAKGTTVDSVSVQMTGSFRANEALKDFSGLQIQANIGAFNSEFVEAAGISITAALDDDSISYHHHIDRISNQASFDLALDAKLTDSLITLDLENFILGQEAYKWTNTGIPVLSYSRSGALAFNNFQFFNNEERLSFDGIFSDQPEDSVNYTIRNVNLDRISELIKGRINLSGTLDGSFTTKSLTRIPTIQGDLAISAFAIDDRVVGDIKLNSKYNSEFDRFDTRIEVATDSAKYPDYFTRNERVGQSIILDGFVLAPDENGFPDVDSLYYFDLDFESIDLWILPFIAPRVFEDMSGIASGKGTVFGNMNDFDYNVEYDIGADDAVYFKPRFLETFYYAQGGIALSKSKGLEFRDVYIIDPSGGNAVLSGSYNLGHLGRIHDIDIRVEMSEFQFLNSDFDPDLTFFGDAYGTTIVRITGTNLNPVITTETPVLISDFSSIGIPLLAETEFDEDNKFIRFVESFDQYSKPRSTYTDESGVIQIDEEANPFDASFAERFTLDLQFVANNSMTVELIFDPVTGDMIQADGTGRIGIRLEDEEFSMFGQFDISGGTYNFVSGEIFTRRFQLEPGGTMIWEGSPANARLNINAIYEARPDINTLTTARSDLEGESSQRVPVQLVLNVGGSLSAIENEFYFRLPNTIETRQNTTLSTQINALNRNEDEKLIQAASFLLMGDFIPSTTASTDATNSIANNFSGSGAVLNPLLSSQLISPLLSNQINSLLRSDIGSLDIDFNLNTYNNVDLGVALRLYNDRIILSREGQITGSQSNIGDLGATYRINQTLSVTAFHRQDPTFSTLNGAEESQQAQDINGVGLEAEMSFNTWQEFFRKLSHPFRRLFGKKEDTEELASAE